MTKYIWYRCEDAHDTHYSVPKAYLIFSYLPVENTKDVTSPCSLPPLPCPETPTSPAKQQQQRDDNIALVFLEVKLYYKHYNTTSIS